MAAAIQDLITAFALLTIVPVPSKRLGESRPLGMALAWFPIVGLCLGSVLAIATTILQVFVPGLVSAALVLALWSLLTGALHLEGLADTGDGLGATAAPEKRLQIMHDPRLGAFGVVTLVLALVTKFAAISSLYDVAVIILAPVLARWAMVFAACFPLARQRGMAALFREGFGKNQILVSTVLACATCIAFGWRGAAGLAGTAAIVLIMARLATSRLGGLNGDVYGAIGELVEVYVLLLGTAVI